jgi:hypothetical protein
VVLAFVIIWNPKSIIIPKSAQVINPIKIFDSVGADLVLGLPLTEEGYNGILLITEYLTGTRVISQHIFRSYVIS